VEGWRDPAYLHPDARTPRAITTAALLSPFDPVIWYRPRAERLFDFDFRIEMYIPREKRKYGYYVLPFLLGERIVGRLSLSRDPHPASRHVADLGLMVAVSHRRRGVGTALLHAAVEWAREAGVRKLELHVFPWNEPALGLYENFGFEREGYRRRHYERGGELVDAILMAYFVEPIA